MSRAEVLMFPDQYRANDAQKRRATQLVHAGLLGSPMGVTPLDSGAVCLRDKEGRSWRVERDGTATDQGA